MSDDDLPRPPPARDRQTSFAREFFSAGTDPSVLNMMAEIDEDGEDEEVLPDSVVIPRSRPMGRRASTRKLMRSSVTRMSSRSLMQTHMSTGVKPTPAAPAMEGDTSTPTTSERGQFRRASRQPSWYREMLEAGYSQAELADLLDDPDADMDDETGGESQRNADEMLAEQHRFLALIEAKKLVQENLGYDPDERRQQMKPPPPPAERTRPCPLPTLKTPNWKPNKDFPYSVPPKEIPIYSERFIRQRVPRQPELQTGEVGHTAGPGQMLVRCLGCKSNLRVSTQATLVQCEQCSIVCPASSTRK